MDNIDWNKDIIKKSFDESLASVTKTAPPNLRIVDSCPSCINYDLTDTNKFIGMCKKYDNYVVGPVEICDSFEPDNKQ